MSDIQSRYEAILNNYQKKFGQLPDEYLFNYGTVELTFMMENALKNNRKLCQPGRENRGFSCA